MWWGLMMWSFAAIFDFPAVRPPRERQRVRKHENGAAGGSSAIFKTHFPPAAPPPPLFSLSLSLVGLGGGGVNSWGVSKYSFSF